MNILCPSCSCNDTKYSNSCAKGELSALAWELLYYFHHFYQILYLRDHFRTVFSALSFYIEPQSVHLIFLQRIAHISI